MKKYLILLALVLGLNINGNAQLSNGSIAPDFTLTDRDGTVHNLYTYLNEGKVVFIKFFACHCPSCWAYHITGKLETLYQTYGPSGTDQVMVIMLEHDVNNPEAFTGQGTYTQGNWETGNSIPMVDVEGADRSVFTDYNLVYYPMVMKVCTDKKVELMSTSYSVADLYQKADDCPGNLGVEDLAETGSVYVDLINQQLLLQGFQAVTNLSIYNLAGQEVLHLAQDSDSKVDISSLTKGMYVLQLEHANGMYSEKILVR